ncbi:hypothetical protein MNBD_GAMMA02-1437 [hydrothermal vent metagenome]|uniref:Lipoprotein n=1 Tax=hydrothermal vent metagenome TaxID=652676 RepID=A0A3B0VK08_9ZZZZ
MIKLAFIIIILLSSCVAKKNQIVLDYTDFGPQVLSYETLGFGWYEWNSHGSKEKDNIKIVIYKNKKSLPLNQYKDSKNSPVVDYRLISYQTALEYLNQNIQNLSQTNEFPEILERLKLTKKKIETE